MVAAGRHERGKGSCIALLIEKGKADTGTFGRLIAEWFILHPEAGVWFRHPPDGHATGALSFSLFARRARAGTRTWTRTWTRARTGARTVRAGARTVRAR